MNIKEKTEKAISKINEQGLSISRTNRYKERVKTSIISIILYFVLIYIAQRNVLPADTPVISLYLAGIIICIYNIVKSILSIKEHEYLKINVILLILQILCIGMFIYLSVISWEVPAV